jgi:hypothetical protein
MKCNKCGSDRAIGSGGNSVPTKSICPDCGYVQTYGESIVYVEPNTTDSMQESFYLHKVIEIQQKFIDGEIDREEFDKQVKEESERYISVLKHRNQEIKCKMESDIISQAIMEKLQKGKL